MPYLYRTVALSDHPAARLARKAYWGLMNTTLPAPRLLVKPMLWTFLAVRWTFYLAKRLLICEPLFKAYCKQYGRGVRTGVFVPWVQGKGDIILGDGVYFNGKVSILFSVRFSERPTIEIGDHTGIGHECVLVSGKGISIGRNCLIAGGTTIIDCSGHSVDPGRRLAGLPPLPEEVRPVTIEDNVWIASGSVILPGVTIGEGSVVSACSVVRRSVSPYTLVGGNPARVLALLPRTKPKAGPPVTAFFEGDEVAAGASPDPHFESKAHAE